MRTATDQRTTALVVPPAGRRPRWWIELAVIASGLWLYDFINNLSSLRRGAALAHGLGLFHLETRLHVQPELGLNRWLAGHPGLALPTGDYYDLAHFVVTLTIFAWVFWRHPAQYRVLRNTWVGIHVIGLSVFWAYPVAPPRMLASLGFVDIVAVSHAVGAWSAGKLASEANEFAAMPSLHVAWALWCVMAVWVIRRDWLSRGLVVLHVLATVVAVLATANHWSLDVLAGAATAAVAAGVALLWQRRHPAPEPAEPVTALSPGRPRSR